MRHAVAAVAALVVAVAALAGASKTEPTILMLTGECVQFDGGQHCDASDDCLDPHPPLDVGEETSGILVLGDDHEDNYAVWTPAMPGAALAIVMNPAPDLKAALGGAVPFLPLPDYHLSVHFPRNDCMLPWESPQPGWNAEKAIVPLDFGGVFVLRVSFPPPVPPLSSSAAAPHAAAPLAALPGFEPQPEGCHEFCVAKGNRLWGYTLKTHIIA